jgi:hypothetical protein
MLQTRIPAPRILDWVDQAILYLHAGPTRPADADGDQRADGTQDAAGTARADAAWDRSATLATLRRYGIRTATDLFNAYEAAKENKRLDQLLSILPEASPGATPRLQAMVDVLRDEEWLVNLQQWRKAENAAPGECEKRVSDLPLEALAAAYAPPGRDAAADGLQGAAAAPVAAPS